MTQNTLSPTQPAHRIQETYFLTVDQLRQLDADSVSPQLARMAKWFTGFAVFLAAQTFTSIWLVLLVFKVPLASGDSLFDRMARLPIVLLWSIIAFGLMMRLGNALTGAHSNRYLTSACVLLFETWQLRAPEIKALGRMADTDKSTTPTSTLLPGLIWPVLLGGLFILNSLPGDWPKITAFLIGAWTYLILPKYFDAIERERVYNSIRQATNILCEDESSANNG